MGGPLKMAEDTRRTAVVIEDDADIRILVETVLRQAGFDVTSTASGTEGVELVREKQPSVVTLDIGLLDIDGLEVARRVRLFSDCYIVMLTAQSDEADLLFGLESGADDYVIKPFRPRELRARIEAMLRRPRSSSTLAPDAATPPVEPARVPEPRVTNADPPRPALQPARDELVYSHNGLTLNADTRTVELDAAELELTRTEFDLLKSILQSKRRVRSKADLVRELRDDIYIANDFVSESEERSIEVHVANLRRKLADDPKHSRWIETVRGVGYRLSVMV
ncbi:DNA-binding response regulator, OmpR family, contains REC and winged-helix (wHTH) domain [Mycetocola miduiensis]|uniref:DNA-binding response regulator, OmpR family, contains REC and winged-helix (WHTH) domain n=2 Tax=Mycetocola miduiensis TaxID=995034 RepID=A0A1I5B3N1_9MICO|nr:DNA-binding response regulator, OmpR family, contains REC and winged-helix (wHTH) domain [Mycetocola miduiensis]